MAKKKPPPKRPGPPRRRKNKDVREREWMTDEEVGQLRRAAAGIGRSGHRDSTMVLMAYRHGLRVSELVDWKWDLVNLDAGTVFVKRVKGSKSTMHTLERDEVVALKKLCPAGRERVGYVFRTDRGGPVSESGFRKIVARAGEAAGLPFPAHPHMLRHACGFELIKYKDIRVVQDWMGHRNIQNTQHYTELDEGRFKREKMWDRSKASDGDD